MLYQRVEDDYLATNDEAMFATVEKGSSCENGHSVRPRKNQTYKDVETQKKREIQANDRSKSNRASSTTDRMSERLHRGGSEQAKAPREAAPLGSQKHLKRQSEGRHINIANQVATNGALPISRGVQDSPRNKTQRAVGASSIIQHQETGSISHEASHASNRSRRTTTASSRASETLFSDALQPQRGSPAVPAGSLHRSHASKRTIRVVHEAQEVAAKRGASTIPNAPGSSFRQPRLTAPQSEALIFGSGSQLATRSLSQAAGIAPYMASNDGSQLQQQAFHESRPLSDLEGLSIEDVAGNEATMSLLNDFNPSHERPRQH